MKKDVIYILMILVLVLVIIIMIVVNRKKVSQIKVDTKPYDELKIKYDSLVTIKMIDNIRLKNTIDSLQNLPEKIKYTHGQTKIIIADGSVAILDSIIRSESGIGFK